MARKSNTRAAHGAGSIRQRADGTWEARVTIGADPGTGKPIRRSIYGSTQADVRKKMTAILRDVDNGTYQAPDKTTVSEWLDTWMKTFCVTKVKPLTYSTYETVIKTHIKPAIGAVKLQSVKGLHIQKLYNGMSDKGLSAKTVKNTAATVAIAAGSDIKSVQDLLGHATASFTLNVYAHTSEQMMKDTAARMQTYYDNLTAKKA